jgi:polyhydroxyalkanoate synthase subunit PhaC
MSDTSTPGSDQALRELAELQRRFSTGLQTLRAAADVSFGCSAKELVYRDDKLRLYRYRALAERMAGPPLLIVYALVNRPYMMDLQPDRSVIRRLLELGLDIYLIDWGDPDGADRYLDLDDYINRYIDGAVSHMLSTHGIAAVNMLGVCQGGTFSLCYAALRPDRVRNLITMVTPVDFHSEDNLLAKWARGLDIDALVASHGVVPGEVLNAAFVALMPFRLLQQKYVNFLDIAEDQAQVDNFMRMEKWIFDSPDQAGEAFRQFVRWFFQENRLMNGTVTIGGQHVDLQRITQPILNVYGKLDHLVPPSASVPLEHLTGSRDYSALPFNVGHIGMYVSARSQKELPQAIAHWLSKRNGATPPGTSP